MTEFLTLFALLSASVDVRVDLLDAPAVTGMLAGIDASSVTLTVNGASRAVPLTDVVTITRTETVSAQPDAGAGHLVLTNDAVLAGHLTTLTARHATVRSTVGELQIPRKQLRAVRLFPENREWEDQWQTFLNRQNDSDLLILKKRDGSGLDFYRGVISTVSSEHIEFVLDGDPIPVPRGRVWGLVFPTEKKTAPPNIRVVLADGSVLPVAQLTLNDQRLAVTTAWQQKIVFPVAQMSTLDFRSGRFHYLSDLDPVRETYHGIYPDGSQAVVLSGGDDELARAARELWKMHRDEVPMGPFGPLPLTLRGRTYHKGLWLFPHCRIDYALDGRYSRFLAVVGVDDEVAFNCGSEDEPSRVELTILADGTELWHRLIDAPADPLNVRLDVQGVRTLSFVVDFGDGDSACDFLDLADARLLVTPR